MKRILCLLLALCVAAAMLPPSGVNAIGSNNSTSIDEADLSGEPGTREGDYMINGVCVREDDYDSFHDGCWIYANDYYCRVWPGHHITPYRHSSDNLLRNLSKDECYSSASHIRAFMAMTPLGANMRIVFPANFDDEDQGGHSQFIVAKSETGFTVLEGGITKANHHRCTTVYTWQSFEDEMKYYNFLYIKYIKFPNAPAYPSGMPTGVYINNPTNSNRVSLVDGLIVELTSRYHDTLTLTITDEAGNTVRTQNVQTGTFRLNFDEPGTYTAVLTATNEVGSFSSMKSTFEAYWPEPVNQYDMSRTGPKYSACPLCGGLMDCSRPVPSRKLWGTTVETEGSCESTGVRYTVCKMCGSVLASETTPALGHEMRVLTFSPTCTKQGYTDHICSRCGYVATDSFTDPLPHDWDEYGICTSCGLDHGVSETTGEVSDKPKDHDHCIVVESTAPTCKKAGCEVTKCEICGQIFAVRETQPVAHQFETKILHQPSDVKIGTAYQHCKVCGLSFYQPIPKEAVG